MIDFYSDGDVFGVSFSLSAVLIILYLFIEYVHFRSTKMIILWRIYIHFKIKKIVKKSIPYWWSINLIPLIYRNNYIYVAHIEVKYNKKMKWFDDYKNFTISEKVFLSKDEFSGEYVIDMRTLKYRITSLDDINEINTKQLWRDKKLSDIGI